MKPKQTRKPGISDRCQTPPEEALPCILPHLVRLGDGITIWDSCAGMDQLSFGLAEALPKDRIIATDILDYHTGRIVNRDFFNWQPEHWDIQIANPPGTQKYKWLKHSFELNKPFGLLVPVDTLGAIQFQSLAKKFGCTVMLLDHRINYFMPLKGYTGKGAQFSSIWIGWQLFFEPSIVSIIFGSVTQVKRSK